MQKKTGTVSAREKRFCQLYAAAGDAVEAAAGAGYENAEKAGTALLAKDEILNEIGSLYEKRLKNARQKAYAGYERIAFGNVNDAVRLLFDGEDYPEAAEGYDLFNVAEIRRPKEGALEIKFFDRLKALEKLEQYGQESRKGINDFYQALVGGIRNLHQEKQEVGDGDNEDSSGEREL